MTPLEYVFAMILSVVIGWGIGVAVWKYHHR